MLLENSIPLKNNVSCNFMVKYEIPVSLRQFKQTFNQFFHLSGGNENLEMCVLDLCNLMNQRSLKVILLDNALINGHSVKYKIAFLLKTTVKI